MSPSDFLRRVCPDGRLVVAKKVNRTDPKGKPYVTFAHAVCAGADDAAAKLSQLAKGHDVYYALASWKQGFHEVKAKSGKVKKVLRVRDNVENLKALWFDIDFKGGYEDPQQVVLALQKHCKSTGLPPPSILIHSGNGIHAYWPLEEAIPYDQWQVLADAFKEAAKKTGLQADLVCTADACRVLRPPGTKNLKDPNNPKPVRVLHYSDRDFTAEEISECLPDSDDTLSSIPQHLKNSKAPDRSNEFTGSNVGNNKVVASFDTLAKHCAYGQFLLDSHGKECDEPEWKDSLQLLSHCEDGELYLHAISDGHPGYSPDEAREKYQARIDSGAGPTLCTTFASYRPEICHKCPHWQKIKTPVHLGQADESQKPLVGLPLNYRIAKKGGGIQKLVIDMQEGTKEWVRILRHNIDNLRVTRSVQDNTQEITLEWWAEGGRKHTLEIPGGVAANLSKLREHCGTYGLMLIEPEPKEFARLMGSWIEQLQRNKKETRVTEQLGWIVEKNEDTDEEVTTGFSCGSKTFMRDGTEEGGVRVKKEYEPIAKYYEPKGSLKAWQAVANFITDQNYPAYTAVLATAFAAPLIRFTGEQGALVSLYSQESGVGKSSTMKIAQSVWGSPIHGVNSVNDTRNSVTRKIGFINNLPAYWDELRGEGTMDEFCELAFQITQGKEKSRLDSSARLRTSVAWCTMMVAASNDSIFDALGRKYRQTDAGMARVFEINVQPVASDVPPTTIANMVDKLQLNYGHAGREYAKWLSSHVPEAEAIYTQVATALSAKYKRKAVERFWFAAMASMIAGAVIAKKAGIIEIDINKLEKYLGKVLTQLRARSSHTVDANSPMELVAIYEQAHQDRILTVKEFPPHRNNGQYEAEIIGAVPASNKIIIWRSVKDNAIRFSRQDFSKWLESRDENPGHVIAKLKRQHQAVESKSKLALGTKLELPRMQVLEVPYQ